MEVKMAVVGDRGSVLGFKAVGFDVFEAEGEAASELIDRLAVDGYGIVFITEQVAALNRQTMDKYKEDTFPAIIPIPGKTGNLGIGMGAIHDAVERAAGTDIFNNK